MAEAASFGETSEVVAMHQTRAFYESFWTLWRWTLTLCGSAGLLVYGMSWLTGVPLPIGITATLSLGFGAVLALVAAAFPVYVSSDGLRCYNFWGAYSTVPWSNISQVRTLNVCGMKYARVSSTGLRSDLTVPLNLANMEAFIEAIREHVDDDHPLVAFLVQQ